MDAWLRQFAGLGLQQLGNSYELIALLLQPRDNLFYSLCSGTIDVMHKNDVAVGDIILDDGDDRAGIAGVPVAGIQTPVVERHVFFDADLTDKIGRIAAW